MNKIILTLIFLFQSILSQSINELISLGEEASTIKFNNQLALQYFEKANNLEKNNYEVLWRLARTYLDIGEHSEESKQLSIYEKSLSFSELAIKANPQGSMGYMRRAAAVGKVALFKGVWESLDLVGKIKSDLEKSIQLDKANPGAYYILARTHAKLCEKPKFIRIPLGIGWANMSESISKYEKALQLRPNFIMYNLDAAKAYIEIDEYHKAKILLHKIPTLQKEDEDDEAFKNEAESILNKIKNK
ncbi:MAG: hypothetical protein O3A55_07680 [Bacteroidetes bacterium]|nr:hypothetical protein [Bacteroidota bacterium]